MPYPAAVLADPELKQWLIRTLEPLCDADPEVMSDYIIALLTHDAAMTPEEWPDFVARELVDFTEDRTEEFVKLLFETLSTRSYSMKIAPVQPQAPIPTPQQVQQLITQTSAPNQPPQKLPPTAPRATGVPPSGPSIVSSYRPPNQQDQPSQAGPSNPKFSPQNGMNGSSNGVGGDHGSQTEPVLGASGKQLCFDYHNKGFCFAGVSCPFEHSPDSFVPTPEMMFPQPFPFPPNQRGNGRGGYGRGGRGGPPGGGRPNIPMDMPFIPPFPFPPFPFQQQLPFNPPGPLPPPNGAFIGTNKPPTDRNGSTLLILNIPPAHLSNHSLTTYFSAFGDITSVALDKPGNRALVDFGTNHQAFKAWKSDDPVWGSRNVRVLWHRPRPGQGGLGLKVLEKNKGVVERIREEELGAEERLRAQVREIEEREKRGKRERLMAEQKVLLKRAKEGSRDEKKILLVRLREVVGELAELDKVDESGDVEMGEGEDEKSRLHKELEKHGMETVGSTEQKELMQLSAQLSELKEKASTMGIQSASSARYSPYARPSPRGRGRGRGRGGFAGPMRLDNRSRGLLLAGSAIDGLGDENWAKVKEYYEGTGGVLQKVDGGWKVDYPNREMAERVMTAGTKAAGDVAAGISMGWWTQPTGENGSGTGSAGGNEVEMVEEEHRGERDEED